MIGGHGCSLGLHLGEHLGCQERSGGARGHLVETKDRWPGGLYLRRLTITQRAAGLCQGPLPQSRVRKEDGPQRLFEAKEIITKGALVLDYVKRESFKHSYHFLAC